MIGGIAYLLCVAVAVGSGNPAAVKPWHWTFPRPLVAPVGLAKSTRIVGGTEATPNSWPHQAALFIDDIFFCGGSLISNEWVMTAAHCMDGASSVVVVMGAHNITANEPGQQTLDSTEFFTHEKWSSTMLINDIALIKLPLAVTFNSNISAINLPSSDITRGQVVIATGWGLFSDFVPTISSVLRQVELTVISNAACQAVYRSFIHPAVVCSDGTDGKGTCNGDSGSSLIKDGEVHGITSFGAAVGCAEGYPDAFTRVYHYLDWIQNKTGVTP